MGLIDSLKFFVKAIFNLFIATKAIFSAVGTNGKITVLCLSSELRKASTSESSL
jgi:hypothetical protein